MAASTMIKRLCMAEWPGWHPPPTLAAWTAVKNHGVPASLISELFEIQRKFFALPQERKETILVDKNNR